MKSHMIVTARGQVTIPKRIRDRNGFAAGTRLEISDEDGEIVVRRARPAPNPHDGEQEFRDYLERVSGALDLGMSTDEYMQLLRGE
jgi:AbrB family looped-hinge helix DNA binding protein